MINCVDVYDAMGEVNVSAPVAFRGVSLRYNEFRYSNQDSRLLVAIVVVGLGNCFTSLFASYL